MSTLAIELPAKMEENNAAVDSPSSGSSEASSSDTSVSIRSTRHGLRDRSKLKRPEVIQIDDYIDILPKSTKRSRKTSKTDKNNNAATVSNVAREPKEKAIRRGPKNIMLSRFDCPICGGVFTTEGNLRVHVKNLHNPNNEKFLCDLCDKVFTCQRYVEVHKRRTHRDVEDFEDEPYQCELCYKKFGYKASVKKHMQVFHSDVTETYECEMCDFVTRYADSLRNHTLYVHQDQVEAYVSTAGKHEPVIPDIILD